MDHWPAHHRPAQWPAADAAHLLVYPQQMQVVEQAMFSGGMPPAALMEKAALAVSRRVRELLGTADAGWGRSQPVVVLIGPGHNGGDGAVVARELHVAGWEVTVWSPFARHKPLTADHLEYLERLGVPRLQEAPTPGRGQLWIDALFGLGQSRPLPGPLAALAREARLAGQCIWAVDVPSGLDDCHGQPLGACFHSRRTFCLGLYKRGLVQATALASVGQLERVDFGVPNWALDLVREQVPLPCGVTTADRATAPWPEPPSAADKYGRGRLLLLAGSQRYPGAAVLAAAGADASGAGAIAIIMEPDVARRVSDGYPHVLNAAADLSPPLEPGPLVWRQLPDLDRYDAVLLGPGMDFAPFTAHAWEPLQRFAGLLVLDADGLNRLAATPEGEAVAWLRGRRGPTWITPHVREFDRLFPACSHGDHPERAAAAARAAGITVLLKGPRTAVAAADGRCWQLLEGAPTAARAGVGDVLAGFAAGRGAMAAATGQLNHGQLARAALDHVHAARQLVREGWTHPSPPMVAERLRRQDQQQEG
ncbi:MAG: NAD(P)H-hydrate dehydratase [Synechococcus sp. SB0662_bin_14]|nr:NAD(P)H-hydrate dehydratase [Synechococcus sp. SB0662_bin_14]